MIFKITLLIVLDGIHRILQEEDSEEGLFFHLSIQLDMLRRQITL
jgi:hypothetical protein